MTGHYEQIDQYGAGQGRVHETRSAGARVQPGRVRADDQTDAGQAQYLNTHGVQKRNSQRDDPCAGFERARQTS